MELRLDQPVPLTVALQSGQTDLKIFANIFNPLNGDDLSGKLELIHLTFGTYTNRAFNMPGLSEIVVVYSLFESDGVTPYVDGDSRGVESYYLKTAPSEVSIKGSVRDVSEAVFGEIKDESRLIVVIKDESNLIGTLED